MKIRMKFKKDAPVMFISHLDMMRAFGRALRRANLPVAFTQGFNPRPKMTFSPALSVGVTSSSEYVDIEFLKELTIEDVIQSLNNTLPEGIHIIKAGIADENLPLSMINTVIYHVKIDFAIVNLQELDNSINSVLQRKEVIVEKVTKSRTKLVNIAPFIYQIGILHSDNNSNNITLSMTLSIGQKGSISPKVIIKELEKTLAKKIEILSIHREQLFIESENNRILPI